MIFLSLFGKYIHVKYKNGELVFSETEAIGDQRKRFGKHLLFSSELEAESEWVITQYRAKERTEVVSTKRPAKETGPHCIRQQ
jgi:hypothetical protein